MMTTLIPRYMFLVPVALAIACATESSELPSGVPLASLHAADDPPQFSDWSAPVNLGPPVNTSEAQTAPFVSRDGLSLYFAATRPGSGSSSDFDVYVSQRVSVDAAWGPPENLGPPVNSSAQEGSPRLSPDGHRLYFASTRVGGSGGNDLYVSRRRDKRDNFGWQTPVNLGSTVNTTADETSPTFFEDDETGTITVYFDSNRPGRGDGDIYVSSLLPDGTFGAAVLVEELSTASRETQTAVRQDGLEIFFLSNRLPREGMTDLWVSTRVNTSDSWSTPVNLGPVVNTTFVDGSPALSFDGTVLYFHSNANRPGRLGPCFGDPGPCIFDIYVTTRSKLRGSN